MQTREQLAAEARFFHDAFFEQRLAEEVVARDADATSACLHDLTPETESALAKIVEHRLDVEAIEFVLRTQHRRPELTRKLQILFYLVEVRAPYYRCFIESRPGLCRGLLALVGAGARTARKYLAGRYLVWRHGLV